MKSSKHAFQDVVDTKYLPGLYRVSAHDLEVSSLSVSKKKQTAQVTVVRSASRRSETFHMPLHWIKPAFRDGATN